MNGSGTLSTPLPSLPVIQAYLLGQVSSVAIETLQRRLMYEVAGEPGSAAVIFYDAPTEITIGREGSQRHLRRSPDELASRGLSVRWVGRGGGVMLHCPGQVTCYPIIPVEQLGIKLAQYRALLHQLLGDLLVHFGLPAVPIDNDGGYTVRGRRIAHLGTAVRQGVSSYGLVINVSPDLALFRDFECDGDPRPMTSMQRESLRPIRLPAVRQFLLERLYQLFTCERLSVFHHHPALSTLADPHAIAARHRTA